MSVLAFFAREATLLRRSHNLQIKELENGRFAFALDGKPISDIDMLVLCSGIVEAIRSRQRRE